MKKKLISIDILPLKSRNKASKEDCLKALEALEEEVHVMLENPVYKLFKGLKFQIDSLSDSLVEDGIKITSEEKDFDRLLKIFDSSEKTGRGLDYLLESSTKKIVKESDKKDFSRRGERG